MAGTYNLMWRELGLEFAADVIQQALPGPGSLYLAFSDKTIVESLGLLNGFPTIRLHEWIPHNSTT